MFSDSTEESLKSQINTNGNVLQDLGMDGVEGRTFLFQNREGVLLLKTGERDTIAFIGRFAHLQQVVIEPTTLFKGLVELVKLFLGWVDTVQKHFQHILIVVQTGQECKRGAAPPLPKQGTHFIPMAQARGLRAILKGKVHGVRLETLLDVVGQSCEAISFCIDVHWIHAAWLSSLLSKCLSLQLAVDRCRWRCAQDDSPSLQMSITTMRCLS